MDHEQAGIKNHSHIGGSSAFSVALNCRLNVSGKLRVNGCRGIFGQKSDALGNRPARWQRRVNHRHRQLPTFNHNFRTRTHARQHPSKIAGRSTSETWITRSAMPQLYSPAKIAAVILSRPSDARNRPTLILPTKDLCTVCANHVKTLRPKINAAPFIRSS
jgi:hypothetical protein